MACSWLVGLSELSIGMWTKGSLVRFPIRALAWVVDQAPSRARTRDIYTLMFLSLPFPLHSPLSKNKQIKSFFKKSYLVKESGREGSFWMSLVGSVKAGENVWTLWWGVKCKVESVWRWNWWLRQAGSSIETRGRSLNLGQRQRGTMKNLNWFWE